MHGFEFKFRKITFSPVYVVNALYLGTTTENNNANTFTQADNVAAVFFNINKNEKCISMTVIL